MDRKELERKKMKELAGNNIMAMDNKKLVEYVEKGILKKKSYQQMARESGIHHRKISKVAREQAKYDRKAYIRKRTKYIAAKYLAGDRPVDIAIGLGIDRQLVNYYLREMVWEDYEDLNKYNIEM